MMKPVTGVLGTASAVVMMVASVGMLAGMAGCRVHVDKDSEGKEKTVQVDTPFGGVHVNTDQTSAADLGLPLYPGAKAVSDDKHKSADVHMGFGDWQLRVKAASYGTPDDRDKVTAFYKKALTRFGDVITCNGKEAVGTPIKTREGLTCEDDANNNKVKVDEGSVTHDFQLKAGSKRHQHIVGFENSKSADTRFVLIALDLPGNFTSDGDKKQ